MKMTCLTCNGLFTKEDPFLDLSLPIVSNPEAEVVALEGG
jgi:hypothetical protein